MPPVQLARGERRRRIRGHRLLTVGTDVVRWLASDVYRRNTVLCGCFVAWPIHLHCIGFLNILAAIS